ncbi:LysR family transcriptional regulator [Acetobacteraceae bacterium H6797]|nr:LysR family transcriptional regulator [Acetobacteraceae bacterium H6797]
MPPPTISLAFDLRGLEIFLAVCDAGGMAPAARQLGLTQPAVSQSVAEMEARLGTRLFDRALRPIGLTTAGSILRQRASMLLAEARQIGPLLHQAGREKLPLLRLGLVDSLTHRLSAPLAAFLKDMAEQSSILSGLTASHATALLTRQLDLFIGADELQDVEGLERELLHEEPYILLCPENLPPPERPADLLVLAEALPLLRFSARSLTGIEIERHLRRLRLDIPRRQEFDTPQALNAAAVAGLGWAITTPLCLDGADLTGMSQHRLPGPALMRRLVLIAREKELGGLPGRVAAIAREALAVR